MSAAETSRPRSKAQLRHELLSARAEYTSTARELLDDALLRRGILPWIEMTCAQATGSGRPGVLAAYVPSGTEPGASLGRSFIDMLAGCCGGLQLLLPVCPPGEPTALQWGLFNGKLKRGKYGLLEPDIATAGGVLPPTAISDVDAILVPGLAADPVTGMRMGRGAGYYDRSLALVQPTVPTAVALNPGEVIEGVPHDEYDRRIDAILTAEGITYRN